MQDRLPPVWKWRRVSSQQTFLWCFEGVCVCMCQESALCHDLDSEDRITRPPACILFNIRLQTFRQINLVQARYYLLLSRSILKPRIILGLVLVIKSSYRTKQLTKIQLYDSNLHFLLLSKPLYKTMTNLALCVLWDMLRRIKVYLLLQKLSFSHIYELGTQDSPGQKRTLCKSFMNHHSWKIRFNYYYYM